MTMDLKRVLLYFALFMVSMTLWQTWISETRPMQAVDKPAAHTESSPPQAQVVSASPEHQSVPVVAARQYDKVVGLKTDTLDINVALHGGSIISSKLLKYPQTLDSDAPFLLLNNKPEQRYVAESGVSGFGLENGHLLDYQIVSNTKTGKVQRLTLEATITPGVKSHKMIEVTDGSYIVNVIQRIDNQSSNTVNGRVFNQIIRQPQDTSHGFFGVSSYTGAAVSLPPEKLYQKVPFDTIKKENLYKSIKAGWVAMQQPYFISAWVPDENRHSLVYSHYTSAEDNPALYTIGTKSTEMNIKPGTSLTVKSRLYTGPVITSNLRDIAPGLELAIDYGIFWWFSTPIFYVLKKIHDVVGNWGWAIVLITILIKLLFFHLSAKSYHSMARLRQLQPKVDALRERYKDNKEKMTKAMMELYSKEKVSPFGGCLPILVQIPVFIALYWVLIESVELRMAPWILWIQDLSAKDPYYILPIIMGATMLMQQMLSPPPADPTQKQVMMAMPIVFTFLFATFPAGLVLYWTVNNSVSILQQWIITKRVESQSK